MSQAFTFTGGTVKAGDGASPEVFTAIAEVQTCGFSGDKVDTVDVTHALSPGGNREFIGTLGDNGEFSFTANLLPTDVTQINLTVLRNSKVPHNFKVVLPNALGTYSFAGIVTGIERSLDFAKEAKLTSKIKITGALTLV